MERFNFQGVRRFWTIARAYWFSDEKWKARGLLLLIAILLLGYTVLSVTLNNQRGELISALSAQSEARFWKTVVTFVGALVVYAPLLAGYTYLQERLTLEWRRWLTQSFVDRYFGDRAFYRLNQCQPEIDNPDQRIAEDIKGFTRESLALGLLVVSSLLTIVAFSGVLWTISRELVLFLVGYAVVGTFVTVGIFGQPLVRLNFEQLKQEANFRFSLVRVREHAEAIAFYQGEAQESEQVKRRFLDAFDNFKKLLTWQLGLNGFSNAYEFIPFILPAVVVAPAVFQGDLEVGKVSEAQGAFIRIFFSLNVVVAQFQDLTAFGAGINRLYDFEQSLTPGGDQAGEIEDQGPEVLTSQGDDAGQPEPEPETPEHIQYVTAPQIELRHLTLRTPRAERTLIEDLSVEVLTQQSVLVAGPSGCGKSSLLRAIAGLWTSGTGTIQRPELGQLLFLPQKPYMVLGSLRQQLLYPYPDRPLDDEQLEAALVQVNLPELLHRCGGLGAGADWGEVLSLGEQQRLSFARVLLHKPEFVILDEATSALDQGNEARLYQQLAATDVGYLSVGHHRSLEAYHHQLLRLAEDHTWELSPLTAAALLSQPPFQSPPTEPEALASTPRP